MRRLSKSKYVWTGIAVLLLIVLAGIFWQVGVHFKNEWAIETFKKSVLAPGSTFSEQLAQYQILLSKIGPVEAQDVLIETLPIGAETHMVDHETGRFLYETQGASGIALCKPYLAGACYHGFIIALTDQMGLGDLPQLFNVCVQNLATEQEANCAHALGHAFLVYMGYNDLPGALTKCEAEFTKDPNDLSQCYNGVFMENAIGNTGDTLPAQRSYKASDPMYPCNEPGILAANAHTACWYMQSQLLMQNEYPQFSGSPLKAEAYCDTLDAAAKDICFNGIALEVQEIANDNYGKVRSLCGELKSPFNSQCIWVAAQTSYFFGDRAADSQTLHVCTMETGTNKDECYHVMYAAIVWSYTDTDERLTACGTLPEQSYQTQCKALMQDKNAVDNLTYANIVDH